MKEWYTNAELAAEKLPGFPATTRGVQKWFSDHDVDARAPHKVRRRKGRGGGMERHISVLPNSLQTCLRVRHIKTMEAPAEARPARPQPADDAPSPTSAKAELRRDAILMLLSFWDEFRRDHRGPIEHVRMGFTTLYRNGKIEGLPGWVTEALKSEGGRQKGVCVSTLRRWEELRDEGRFNELAGRYGNRRGTGVLERAEDGAVAEFLAAHIVRQPHLTADHLRDLVRDRFGERLEIDGKAKPVPHIRTFRRFVTAWKTGHREVLQKMTDPDGFRAKTRFSGTNMNHWVRRLNQLWEIDASPADVLLKDGRHSIYTVVDVYSRRMMVSVSKTPKTAAVLLLVRRAILSWGVPEILRTDNGADFTSHAFVRALGALGIAQDLTDPHSPQQKGMVERGIGTLQRGLMPLLPGFVGHNVADRKKIEQRRSFAQRLGEAEADIFSVDLDATELQGYIDRWLASKYEHKAHGGLRDQTPFSRAAAWPGPIRTIENERALDLMLAPVPGKDGIRTVTKFGIRIAGVHFISADLVPGQRVLCRHDPVDMGRIFVFDEAGLTYQTSAICPELAGTDPGEAIREARAGQASRIAEEAEPLRRQNRHAGFRDMIDAVLRVNEGDSANLTAFPKPTESYTTPQLDAAGDAAGAGEGPAPTPETADDEAARAAFIEEFEAEKVVSLPETAAQRFARAYRLEQQLEAGETLEKADSHWLLGYVQTAEYRSRKSVHEHFNLEVKE